MIHRPLQKEWLRNLLKEAPVPSQLAVLSFQIIHLEYFDPLNSKMKKGWNTHYKSKWAFLLDHKGRMSTKRFLQERAVFQKLPYAMKHSLYHPDDLKKLRDKPFSGLYFHFDKYKEEANKLFKEEKYFEAIDYYE